MTNFSSLSFPAASLGRPASRRVPYAVALALRCGVAALLIVSAGAWPAEIEEEWSTIFEGAAHYTNALPSVAVDSSGNVYVGGTSSSNDGSDDFVTIRYDAAGNEIWVRHYDYAGQIDRIKGMTLDAGGNVIVTGESTDTSGTKDYATIKYDPDGNELWARRFDYSGGNDIPESIETDSSANVYVTGYSEIAVDSDAQFATLKYDPNGNLIWAHRFNDEDPGTTRGGARALSVHAGGVYVVGSGRVEGENLHCTTVKYDSDGNVLWTKKFTDLFGSVCDLVVTDTSGDAFVSGRIYAASFNDTEAEIAESCLTIKYDSSGDEEWVRVFAPGYSAVPHDSVVDNRGNIFVTGTMYVSRGSYFPGWGPRQATVGYDSEGNELWSRIYDYAYADAIAIDELGNVYVTGGSESYREGSVYVNDGFVTVQYDAQGEEQWVRFFENGDDDRAFDMAVDADQNIYVTGHSVVYDSLTGNEYATVKYSRLSSDDDSDRSGGGGATAPWSIAAFALAWGAARRRSKTRFNDTAHRSQR